MNDQTFSEVLSRNIAVRTGCYSKSRPVVVSSSYGNDSVATIQWAKEGGFTDVHVVYIDTGWASEEWPARVERCEDWVRSIGFTAHRIVSSVGFEELILSRGGFPNQRYQWCSGHLKGVPFLDWIDEFDPDCSTVVMIGKRREESQDRSETPEWVIGSEYHGGRTVRHPLYLHNEVLRDKLIRRAGFEPLPHRSQECARALMPIAATCFCSASGRSFALNALSSKRTRPCSGRSGTWARRVFVR